MIGGMMTSNAGLYHTGYEDSSDYETAFTKPGRKAFATGRLRLA